MADLSLTPDADDSYWNIVNTDPALADAVDVWLDQIEDDPGAAAVRRHRLSRPDLWMITVRLPGRTQDAMILWDIEDGAPVVRYIGPAFR